MKNSIKQNSTTELKMTHTRLIPGLPPARNETEPWNHKDADIVWVWWRPRGGGGVGSGRQKCVLSAGSQLRAGGRCIRAMSHSPWEEDGENELREVKAS